MFGFSDMLSIYRVYCQDKYISFDTKYVSLLFIYVKVIETINYENITKLKWFSSFGTIRRSTNLRAWTQDGPYPEDALCWKFAGYSAS